MEKNLEHSPLFAGLNINQIEQLLDQVGFYYKTYAKDEVVAWHDSEITDMLVMVEGSVKGEMIDFTGKTIKIEDIESPRPLAPAFLFGNQNRYPVTIVANNDVKILAIRKDAFIKLMQANDLVLKNFLNNISNRAQFLSSKIRMLSFHTIKGKIANYLLGMIKKTGQDAFILPQSQGQLADLFGVTRPSLARAMRELHNEGLVHASGKQIRILNTAALSALLR